MNNHLYICRSCRCEFSAGGTGIYACPSCGSLDTIKYDPSSILSVLASRLSSSGG